MIYKRKKMYFYPKINPHVYETKPTNFGWIGDTL